MNIKNILLIGRTGGGKSTLANTLINQNNNFEEVFKESAGSVSETKNVQIKEFIVNITEDGSERVRYLVIDTAGFGDTKLTDKEVLELMLEMVKIVGDDGLTQIFFVTNSRFTTEEIEVYQLLDSIIFDNQVIWYTAIVKTKFPEFENETKCEEDRQKFRAENPELARIFNTNKIIYVNNPPLVGRPAAIELNKEIRKESRKRVLTHLGRCRNIYRPGNLNTLNQRIKDYKTQKENLQNEINNLHNQISSAESNHWSQIQNLESRYQQEIQALEQRRQNELNQIRQNSRYGYIRNESPYWTIERGEYYCGSLANRNPDNEYMWTIITDDFHPTLRSMNIPFKHYDKQEAKRWLRRILFELGKGIVWIEIRGGSNSEIWGDKGLYGSDVNSFSDNDYANGLNVELYKHEYDRWSRVYDYHLYKRGEKVTEGDIWGIYGIKYHPYSEYVNLEMALRREVAGREANLTQQIERIKRENQERENRLWQEKRTEGYPRKTIYPN